MKKLLLLLSLAFGLANVHAQTLGQTMYIDFGSNAGTQGQITPSPDVNGHHWNNYIVGNVGTVNDVINGSNVDTGINMEVTDNFIVNSSVNYGPITTLPALGDMGISTATMDYWFLETAASGNNTGAVKFTGLNPAKGYKFQIFASRPTNSVRNTNFVLTGATTFTGVAQTSNGTTGNIDTILNSGILMPTATGEISMAVSINSGGYGYVNVVKIEEFTFTVLDAPLATAQAFCSSNNPTVANLVATGSVGSTLNWYAAATGGTALTATTALVSGSYWVSQSASGSESPRTEVAVTVNATPSAPVITAATGFSFCAGSNTILQSSAPTGTVSYQWYKNGEAITTSGTAATYTATTAGSYTVTVTGAGNCASALSAAVAVTINTAPTVAAITGTATVAAGSTTQLANVTTGGTWASVDVTKATVNAGGLVTGVAAGTATITYTVTAAGCSTTVSYDVVVNNGELLQQTMYIDFGSNAGTNGAITPSPDVNGHYWNNYIVAAVGTTNDIVNSNNADTGYDLEVTNNFIVNTSVNYGPTANLTALGDLGITTATQDYWFLETGGSANNTGAVKFKNLDPTKGYKFNVFASRPTNVVRKTAITFTGLNSFSGQIQTSNGTTGNIDTILSSTIISPNTAGEITLDVSIAQDAYGYINIIKMEEYSNLPITAVTSISVSGADITVSGQASQMTAAVLPADATFTNVVWSVSNPAVAVISQSGVLTPVSNGTVVVTATSAQNTAISGTKTVTVSNQNTQLFISGTATENSNNASTALAMRMVTGPNGAVTNVFEIYTSLTEAGTLNFYTTQGTTGTIYGAGATAGVLAVAGAAIDPTPSGPVLITVNVATGAYTITPINWSVVGSSITNGWNGDAPLTYQGNGVWSATLDMTVVGTDTNPRFVFRANQNWGLAMKKVVGTQHSVALESQAGEFGLTLQDIDLKYGDFIITLNLNNYTYGIECVAIDEYKISFMGSSGLNGQGAVNLQGYAYQYNQMLQQRATNGSSPFYRSNISVNGNNTTSVLNRFEKDLVGDCGSYVVFGLVLGNEGVHETGMVAYNSYLNNIPLLVQMARDINKVPVVQNNYGRGDYNAADYEYIKQMNLLMAQWDVPTTNLLGAMDNGSGNWVNGYWDDALHPNTVGHTELFYAMVPSLFDALEVEKPQPVLATNTYVTPDPVTGGGQLVFTPDNIIHPFTVSFDVQTTGNGHLMAFTTNGTAVGNLAVTTNGFVSYTSPTGATITGTTAINDGAWHKITLTHYYAWGKTMLYTDAAVSGSTDEQLEAKVFSLHGAGAPANVNYRNWFFYRSGMNALEIAAMNDNKMLKSSLELYAPLDREAEGMANMFANLAQSTNNIDASSFVAALGTDVVGINNSFRAYPNPVKDVLTIAMPANTTVDAIEVFNTLGMLVKTVKNTDNVSLSALQSGVYLVKVHTGATTATIKIVKE
jgi:hypothetical protein